MKLKLNVHFNNYKLSDEHKQFLSYFGSVYILDDGDYISINNYSKDLLIFTISAVVDGHYRYIFDLSSYILYKVELYDIFVESVDSVKKYNKNEIAYMINNMEICKVFMNYLPFIEWERKIKIEKLLGI